MKKMVTLIGALCLLSLAGCKHCKTKTKKAQPVEVIEQLDAHEMEAYAQINKDAKELAA
jgi:hypothetical protein